jgi:hypothetical protein
VSKLEIGDSLYSGLNEHGFLFQEKIIEELRRNQERIGWSVLSSEYPVSTGNKDSRIDIILKDIQNTTTEIYSIVECKRAYIKNISWLFGKPLMLVFNQPLLMKLEGLFRSGSGHMRKKFHQVKLTYGNLSTPLIDNWWLEINNGKGNTKPLEDALTQVCIGPQDYVPNSPGN